MAKRKLKKLSCKKALKDLLEYAVGNRGSREGNPYMKEEVKQATIALGEAKMVTDSNGRQYLRFK
jgi:hypothetical protein